MPADEYSTPGGGGKLKLKGSKIADGRVEKKKKKKKQKENETKKASPEADAEQQQQQQPDENETTTTTPRDTSRAPDEADHPEESSPDVGSAGKTEAERRHEEMRKRRVSFRRPLIIIPSISHYRLAPPSFLFDLYPPSLHPPSTQV